MRVLIVDDSNFTRNIFSKIFRELGIFDLDEAVNSSDAIQKLQEKTYDLATVDLIMPSSNGIDVIRYIKEKRPAMKIIVCSSVSERTTVLEIVKLGVDEFILKPFTEERVKQVFQTAISPVS